MAKLSANGNHKVGQVVADRGHGRHVFALRSDGKVLTRIAGFYNDNGEYLAHATGYKIHGRLRNESGSYTRADLDRLANALSVRGFDIVEVK